MYDNYKELDKDKKELMLNNENLTKNFLIGLLRQAYQSEKDKPFYLNDYDFYDYLIFNISEKNTINKDGELTKQLKETYTQLLNNNMIDDIYLEYINLANNEGKQLLYTLSRLLYIQDKYKDDEIGQKVDTTIKEWLELIKTFDDKTYAKQHEIDLSNTEDNEQERAKVVTEYTKKLSAIVLYRTIQRINYDIYDYKNEQDYTKLWNYDKITDEDFIGYLDNLINNKINDSKSYNRYNTEINDFINGIDSKINMAHFEDVKQAEIKAIKDKYNVKDDINKNVTIPTKTQDAFLDELTQLYQEYLNTTNDIFEIDDDEDVKKWRNKAENFIKHLEEYNGEATLFTFNMDYALNYLAYNDYQKETYKTDRDDAQIVIKDIQEHTTTKAKKKPTPKLATQEQIQAYYNKYKEYYNTSTLPTNRAILDTYGAYTSIETNTLDKINIKIKELQQKQDSTNDKETLDNIKYELEELLKKKKEQEDTFKNLTDTIKEKQDNLDKITQEYMEKEPHLSNADKQQYNNLMQTLHVDLIDAKDDLNAFNNRGIAFRGNLFNELEYTDEKGNTIATIRNKNGEVLEPKDIPPLSDLFLTLTNDNYYTRLDNYNEFIGKIDVLFPKNKGASYKIANETIKRNLGKNGYIISVKRLLKDVLHVSENSFKYYSDNLEGAIKFFNDTQINVQQKDKYTKNDDVLNMFFGLTNNVYMSRQVNNDIYLYYEISSVYETILNNSDRPVISQNPKTLLKYSVGQEGSKRVFKLGNYIYNNLRESLNNGKGGVKLDENGHFYKKFKVKSLLKVLKESNLIRKEARPRKYREDIFNPLIATLNTLSVDDEGNGEHLIEYTILYDDSLNMSNDTFKATFEEAIVIITYLKYSEDYDNILAKNIKNKKKAHITSANKFILTFGKYEGKTLKEVLNTDKYYLETLLSDPTIRIPKPKITRNHIKNLLDYEKSKEQLKK